MIYSWLHFTAKCKISVTECSAFLQQFLHKGEGFVGHVAEGEVEPGGRGEDGALVGEGEEAALAVVGAHAGVSDAAEGAKGGVDADATRHVLDWEGKQIPRLYTAGEISSVFKFTYQAGGNLTECVVCGRLAGKNAAAEENWD